jgi:acetamidase/formamidase
MHLAFRLLAAASLLALTSTAAAAAAAAPDATLPSTPKTVVRGYISADTPPVLHIKSGQTVKIDTLSHGGLTDDPVAFFGAAGIKPDQVLQDAKDVAKVPRTEGFGGHVLTGPIYVEGAEPGDMLEVRILAVEVRVPYGVNNPGPGGVAPDLVAERGSKVIKFDMARNVALFSDGVEIPLRPFMGIMAVAPGVPRRVGSKAPGDFGGNLDFARLTAGSTLYLPVFQPGALFVTGDSHGTQGDGEVDGNAIEASMSPTLQFIVHKGEGKAMVAPRAEDASNYYAMGLDKDLDVALKNAVTATVHFLHDTKGLSMSDAYSLSSVGVNFGVGEAVDENLMVYGEIPKKMFKTKTPYWAAAK